MSDTQQGPDWWQATDGKWYPPREQSAHAAPPSPGPDAPKKNTSLIAAGIIGGGLILLCLIGAAIAAIAPKKETVASSDTSPGTTELATTTSEPTTTEPPSTTTTEPPTTTTEPPTTTTEPPTTTTAPPSAPDEFYSGSGDTVQNLTSPLDEPRIATITYQGASNFAVKALGAGGNEDLLVNEIGNYTGTVPIAFEAGSTIEAFEINASGPWTITLKDFTKAQPLDTAAGSRIDGQGDNVIMFAPGKRTTLAVTCPGCQGNFAVKTYGERSDLLVNEIGSYTGTVSADADTVLIEVVAHKGFQATVGPAWSITVQ